MLVACYDFLSDCLQNKSIYTTKIKLFKKNKYNYWVRVDVSGKRETGDHKEQQSGQ